jgi:hypothetical protein
VLKGSVSVVAASFKEGTLVVLEKGAIFGPLVSGPEGTDLLEFYAGDPAPVPDDPESFAALLRERDIKPVPVAFSRRAEESADPPPTS